MASLNETKRNEALSDATFRQYNLAQVLENLEWLQTHPLPDNAPPDLLNVQSLLLTETARLAKREANAVSLHLQTWLAYDEADTPASTEPCSVCGKPILSNGYCLNCDGGCCIRTEKRYKALVIKNEETRREKNG